MMKRVGSPVIKETARCAVEGRKVRVGYGYHQVEVEGEEGKSLYCGYVFSVNVVPVQGTNMVRIVRHDNVVIPPVEDPEMAATQGMIFAEAYVQGGCMQGNSIGVNACEAGN